MWLSSKISRISNSSTKEVFTGLKAWPLGNHYRRQNCLNPPTHGYQWNQTGRPPERTDSAEQKSELLWGRKTIEADWGTKLIQSAIRLHPETDEYIPVVTKQGFCKRMEREQFINSPQLPGLAADLAIPIEI